MSNPEPDVVDYRRTAVVDGGGNVINVINVHIGNAELPEDDPRRYEPPAGLSLVPDVPDLVGPGWVRLASGELAGPPSVELAASEVVGNGVDSVLVAYIDARPGAPAEVTFTVNGATTPPVPVVDGRAELALSAAAPGRVRVEVAGLTAALTAT